MYLCEDVCVCLREWSFFWGKCSVELWKQTESERFPCFERWSKLKILKVILKKCRILFFKLHPVQIHRSNCTPCSPKIAPELAQLAHTRHTSGRWRTALFSSSSNFFAPWEASVRFGPFRNSRGGTFVSSFAYNHHYFRMFGHLFLLCVWLQIVACFVQYGSSVRRETFDICFLNNAARCNFSPQRALLPGRPRRKWPSPLFGGAEIYFMRIHKTWLVTFCLATTVPARIWPLF